jgi:hypothetical protein
MILFIFVKKKSLILSLFAMLFSTFFVMTQNATFVAYAEANDQYKGSADYGIATGDITSLNDQQIDQEMDSIETAGFGWVRFDISWATVQPNNSQTYNWSKYDNIVSIASRYHLRILAILDKTPTWAAPAGCKVDCETSFPLLFSDFAREAALRYQNNINNWEIWNEENVSGFWSPSPSAVQYANILKSTYPVIKSVEPNSTVLIGGLSAAGNSVSSINPVSFLQELYQDGAGKDFDAIGFHPYTFPSTPLSGNNGWSEMSATSPSLRSVMVANADASKKIWITEYGAPTDGPTASSYVGETSQAQMALYAYIAASKEPWIGPLFWYTYQDSGTSTSTAQNFYGLVSASGVPKPAYHIWQQILR